MELAIFCIALVLLIVTVIGLNWPKRNRDESDSHSNDAQVREQGVDRLFTLAELQQAEEGKYSWDETGCVFEVNGDGSVTIVGRIDPASLIAAPERELYERMVSDGLPEMLPRMWSFLARKSESEESASFSLCAGNVFLSATISDMSIAGAKSATISSAETSDEITPTLNLLLKSGAGIVVLMPQNEREYLLALGAQSCLNRMFEGSVRVKITHPSVMGAFWSAIDIKRIHASKFSFAYGNGDDYRCCNMSVDNGLYEVRQLLSSSVILSTEYTTALKRIARGCIVQSLIYEGIVVGIQFLDMLPYAITMVHKADGQVIKIYDIVSSPVSVPAIMGETNVYIGPNNSLALFIGSIEILDNIIAGYNAVNRNVDIDVEIGPDMDMAISIKSDEQTTTNIGDLIG